MKRKLCFALCLALVVLPLLSACGAQKPISGSSLAGNAGEAKGVAYGAGGVSGNYSVCENGLFGMESGLMRYYDFLSKDWFVLCGAPGCRHSDESCAAWYGSENDAAGLAMYGDRLYVVKYSSRADAYELLSMEPGGEGRESVWSLKRGEETAGDWVVRRVSGADYAAGRAWITVEYACVEPQGYSPDTAPASTCLVSVNLADGSSFSVGEPQLGGASWACAMVTPEYVAFERTLPGAETAEYELYDVLTGETAPFEGFEGLECSFWGVYEGEIVFSAAEGRAKSRVFMYDPSTGRSRPILDIEQGCGLSGVLSDGTLLYCEDRVDGGDMRVDCLNLATGESRELFTDDSRISFRIIDETEQKYIGWGYIGSSSFGRAYSIDKADYESGNLKAAEKLFIIS